MTIRLLRPEVSSQIAAGEVIERPASVVKELLENALDAGASGIQVLIGGAGTKLIEVADDGAGIAADELSLAVSRHATSKLSRTEDLLQISTLGFRGEALASIASVSRLTMTSRPTGSSQAARLRVEGGRANAVEAVGAPPGTVVRVEDLFHNVPARLKFLKSEVTERRAIDALLTRYALAYPNVRYRLSHDGAPSLQTSGDGDRRAILAALYGVEVARQLLEIQASEAGMELVGFVSPIAVTRSNRREITIFVNGRWVQDTALTSAIVQAYHTLLMVGRYPLGVLFLDLDPAEVDVNVHPAKSEVRFRSPDRVFGFLQRAVRRGMLSYAPVPTLTAHAWAGPLDESLPGRDVPPPESPSAQPTVVAPSQLPVHGQLPILRPIGQVGRTYVVAEAPDGLYLIDQHAAHERVLFEKLLREHMEGGLTTQALLAPAVFNVVPSAAAQLQTQLPTLRQLGFEVEEFGPDTFQVRAMPAFFGAQDPTAAVLAVIEDFEEDEAPLQGETHKRIAARVCKRLAVRAGQTLSTEEQRSLIADLERCAAPRTCPHGRPTMIHLSVETLERQFGRSGAR